MDTSLECRDGLCYMQMHWRANDYGRTPAVCEHDVVVGERMLRPEGLLGRRGLLGVNVADRVDRGAKRMQCLRGWSDGWLARHQNYSALQIEPFGVTMSTFAATNRSTCSPLNDSACWGTAR